MKTIVIITILMLSGRLVYAQTSTKEAQIRELEINWTAFLERKDTTALRKIFTKDYVVNNASGKIVTADDIFRMLKSGHAFPKVSRDIQKITFNGPLAIVMGAETEHSDSGQTKNRRFTNIWIQTPEGWNLVARQANGGDGIAQK